MRANAFRFFAAHSARVKLNASRVQLGAATCVKLRSRAAVVAALVGMLGCVEVEPPIGQFVCATADECPNEWVCGADSRCYPSPLACYPHAQIGCSPGQGCYTTSSGPVCATAGPLPEYTHACDNANDTLRCGAGTTCVSFTEGTDDNVCLRYCRDDLDCGTAQCAVSLIVSEESARLLGDEIRVCAFCSNTCRFAGDGECDDGREGAQTSLCTFGTDCADCGFGT